MWHAVRVAASVAGPALIGWATLGYIREILHGTVRPHRVGWTIWLIATVVGLVATGRGGAGGPGLAVPATYVAIEAVVAGLAWTDRYGWKRLDGRWEQLLLPLALGGSVGWIFLPLYAGTWVAIGGDTATAIYTLRKTVEDPSSEALWPWATSCLGAACGLLALGSYGFTSAGFPAYLVVQTGMTAAVIWVASAGTRAT